MNPTEEQPHDQLQAAASMATGLIFLLGRTLINADRHPDSGPGRDEKEGIEVLMLEVGGQLTKAVDRITTIEPTEIQFPAAR
jgi:hypothetical protein